VIRINPYAQYLQEVEKPSRYIGGEKFSVKKDWLKCSSKVALCFPDTYELGMGHLGIKILYDQINQQENMLAERVFAPWIDMEKILRDNELPLVSLESFRALHEFDIVGFTLQYELSYTNILNMLELGRVPVFQSERKENDPIVIVGGPCATHPEPLADFVDCIVVGDGEKIFTDIIDLVSKYKYQGVKREAILRTLSKFPGVYVPSLYTTKIDEVSELEVIDSPKYSDVPEKIKKFLIEDINKYPFPTKSPVSHMSGLFDRFSVELSRGCTEGCRFCQAGMIYRPVRERSPKTVVKNVVEGMKNGGYDEASLTCLSTADYSAVTPLIVDLVDKISVDKAKLGISSLRAYGLDEVILDKLAGVKSSSLTFAPEAGTQRMRDVINKNISEEDMLKTAHDIFTRGWSKMKLYFMIGLPTEEDEDVIGIMETARKAKRVAHQSGVNNPTLTVSVSTFVPKPHTPFQWSNLLSLDEIKRKQEMLFDLSRKYKLRFRKHYSKGSLLECLVARGDRQVGKVIYSAYKKGARFDGWDEGLKYEIWEEAITECGVNLDNYLKTIRLDSRLPWDHIDVGLEDKFLLREWKKAVKNRLSPPCGKPAGAIVHHTNLEALQSEKKNLVCYHCGIECDLKGMVDERKDYLIEMDAIENKPYERVTEKLTSKKIRKELDSKEAIGGFLYRISFSKVGNMSFISHLDLQKIMARIFKRAGCKVSYTQGFHPRPMFSLGPALSLGVSSFAEFLDVRIESKLDNLEKTLKELNENAEDGISFMDINLLEGKVPSIQSSIENFNYFIPLEDDKLNTQLNINKLIEKLEAQETVIVKRFVPKKKEYKEKDLKPLLKDLKPLLKELKFGEYPINDEIKQNLLQVYEQSDLSKGIYLKSKVNHGSSIRADEMIRLFEQEGFKVKTPIKLNSELINERSSV
jgi:radical SAM family uncharacterized protein/radical SAM-linked protein